MTRTYVRKRPVSTYSKVTLDAAIQSVKNKQMTLSHAARCYGIPRSTLYKRVNGQRGVKSTTGGRSTAIPIDEEAKIASCIKTMEKWGFGLSKSEVLQAIARYLKENDVPNPFKNSMPGDEYFYSFKKRHGLSQKKPQAVEVARKRCIDPFIMADYFQLLQKITRGVPPDRIYNLDESSFCLDPTRVKVVGAKGTAAHRVTAGPAKENISVLMGANAVGGKLPPLIIFKAKNVWTSWMASKKDEFPGLSYASTPNGWMDTETFNNYFERQFLNAIPKERPVVLIYDGHSSHTSLRLIEKALQEQVVILKLPPHTSHLLQPMDLSVFKSLKQRYDELLIAWQRKNYGVKASKSVFSTLISQAWNQFDKTNIISGFKKAGIFPFSDKVIPDEKYEPGALERFNRLQRATTSATNELTCQVNIQHASVQVENASAADGSFEKVLLEYVKQSSSASKEKRRKICAGAEVITSSDALETLKNSKKTIKDSAKKRIGTFK